MHARNAASVLPEPVGDRMSVCFRWAMRGQPRRCGGLGSPKRRRNQATVIGWKVDGKSVGSIERALPFKPVYSNPTEAGRDGFGLSAFPLYVGA
jgi:hypothetical protein